jgi:membrane-associated protease RseP (regulator of RpoE activity)
MRRAMMLTAALLIGAPGVALADRGAPSQPSPSQAPATADVYTFSTSQGRLGLVVIGLTDELKQFYGSGKGGVLVGKVEPGSPADKAGLKVGDVVADVDGKAVDDAGDVLSLLSGKKKGDAVALTVMRNHMPLMLTARMQADAAPAMRNLMPRDLQGLRGMPDPFQAFGFDDDAMKRLDQRLGEIEQRLDRIEHPQSTH